MIEKGHAVQSGPIPDQAALHGLLAKVRDLGLSLLSVKRVEAASVSRAVYKHPHAAHATARPPVAIAPLNRLGIIPKN